MPGFAGAGMGAVLMHRLLIAAVLLWPAVALPAETFCTAHTMPEEVVDRGFGKPMRYSVAKVDGKTVLQASGSIERGEAERLSSAILKAGVVDEIWLHSPGGVALEGPKMGRVIRKAGLLTRLRSGQACISSCSMAFLGGLLRVVEPGGHYGIHMMTASRNTELMIGLMDEMGQLSRLRKSALRRQIAPSEVNEMMANAAGKYVRMLEQMAARVAADQARYLVEMSISVDFLTEEFAQSAQGVCYLGEAGLRKFNVANAGAVLPGAPVRPAPMIAAPVAPAASGAEERAAAR